MCGKTLALNGMVGGDHIIYVDFKQRFDLEARIARATERNRTTSSEQLRRCQRTAGIAVVDVAGHRMTDALLAAMLHQAFLLGAIYELDMFGGITKRLFENLNTRFYQSSGAHKFISLIYGEISEDARFRFLSAGTRSRRCSRVVTIGSWKSGADLRVSFPPLGMQPSLHAIDRSAVGESTLGFKDRYETNEWWLMGAGDILLLHTDGLIEHARGDEPYFPGRLEDVMRAVKHLSAREILDAHRRGSARLQQAVRRHQRRRHQAGLVIRQVLGHGRALQWAGLSPHLSVTSSSETSPGPAA